MSEPHLQLDHVAVRFGATVGLPSVSLQLAKGERLVLLGPSGVGKSSLLRVVAGLDPVAQGRIHLGGRDVTTLDPRDRGAVYLQQRPLLFPHLSVVENVAFPLTVRSVPAAEARATAQSLLASVQLEGMADRRSASLSGGQQHRVALARALAARPVLLLLDEPFAALDPSLRGEIREMVMALVARHALTTMLVTHDVDEALRFGDRIAVLLDGGIRQLDTPATLLAAPASVAVARLLGIPNLLPVRRRDDGAWATALGPVECYPHARAGWLVARATALQLRRAAHGEGERADSPTATVMAREERVDGTRWRVRVDGNNVRGDSRITELLASAAPGESLATGEAVHVAVCWDAVQLVADDV